MGRITADVPVHMGRSRDNAIGHRSLQNRDLSSVTNNKQMYRYISIMTLPMLREVHTCVSPYHFSLDEMQGRCARNNRLHAKLALTF